MRRFLFLLLLALSSCSGSQRGIIFDTDWWTDVDDVCALRTLLHAEREGEVRLLGVCLSAVDSSSVSSLSSYLGYEGRKGLPIGADKLAVDFPGSPCWRDVILEAMPEREASSLDDVDDAVPFYRRLLSKEKKPVDIVAVGFPNALSRLLESGPDEWSPLSGRELVKRKVRHLWMMAGRYPEGREHNFALSGRSREAGAIVCSDWPTEITFLGFEVGIRLRLGGNLPGEDLLHKVLEVHGSAAGRYAWDPLLTWIACLDDPEAAGFETVRGSVSLDPETGDNHFSPASDGPHRYVRMVRDSVWYARRFCPILGEEDTVPVLDALAIPGSTTDRPFDPDASRCWVTVPHDMDTLSLIPQFAPGLDVEVYAKAAAPGEAVTAPLVVGQNNIGIIVRDPKAGLTNKYTVYVSRLPDESTLYREQARPGFHFTPFMYQMNDPNGLVYDASSGLYHLFFQCNRPFDTGVAGLSGTTSWGHATSADLLHWEEQPLALTPDFNGMAWSGSGAVDRDNTSGLFDASTPPDSRIVLFYASVGADDTYGFAKESMAYTLDGGKTFLKYSDNPVVRNPGNKYGDGLRDPKVFWYEDTSMPGGGIWVMVTVGKLNFFTSRNLRDWRHCGSPVDVHGEPFDSECPDLFPLPVDGDPDNVKWVYTGGGLFYILGHLERRGEDGVMFVAETEKTVPLNGIADQIPGIKSPETYATQTFAAEKKGRRVSISWLRDPSMHWKDKIWNSAQSLPMEHSLRTVGGKVKLFSYPVEEVESLRGKPLADFRGVKVDKDSDNLLKDIHSTCCDLEAEISLGTATQFTFRVRTGEALGRQYLEIRYDRPSGKLFVDKTHSGNGCYLGVYEPELTLLEGGRIRLRILLDQTCFDVYGNDGEAAVAGLVFSEFENDGMSFSADGEVTVERLTVWPMEP
ncbi:MAG: GH32 C-terminal domain-containing protein [Bacteroidales bacterium]|nr:GH32 C-terminal domain-containing protein [Bacteroidales bacterium]